MLSRRLSQIRPTAWVAAEKVIQQLLWLVLFAVLAPILGPKPYGLFSLAMVLVGFCELVLAEAAAEALLSLDHLTPLHLGTANLCSLAAGLTAAALVLLMAQPLARLFHEPILKLLFQALSPLPILSSLGGSPTAILKREMNFQSFTLRSTVGLAIGGGLGVLAALLGAGVWALVIQVLAQRAAEVAILWGAAKGASKLGWSTACFRDLRGCAANVFFAKGLTWGAGQIPRVIVGLIFGPTILGLFTLASRITDVLLQVLIVPATMVARLELRRFAENTDGLEAAITTLLRSLGFVAFPVCVGLAAITPTLFALWLGQRWTGAVEATQILVLTVAPWIYFYCATSVIMGLRLSRLEVVIQAVLGLSAAAVTLAAAPFGLNAVCLALLIRLALLIVMPLWMLRRAAGIKPLSIFLAPAGPAAAAAAMGVCVMMIAPWQGAIGRQDVGAAASGGDRGDPLQRPGAGFGSQGSGFIPQRFQVHHSKAGGTIHRSALSALVRRRPRLVQLRQPKPTKEFALRGGPARRVDQAVIQARDDFQCHAWQPGEPSRIATEMVFLFIDGGVVDAHDKADASASRGDALNVSAQGLAFAPKFATRQFAGEARAQRRHHRADANFAAQEPQPGVRSHRDLPIGACRAPPVARADGQAIADMPDQLQRTDAEGALDAIILNDGVDRMVGPGGYPNETEALNSLGGQDRHCGVNIPATGRFVDMNRVLAKRRRAVADAGEVETERSNPTLGQGPRSAHGETSDTGPRIASGAEKNHARVALSGAVWG